MTHFVEINGDWKQLTSILELIKIFWFCRNVKGVDADGISSMIGEEQSVE